MFEFLSGNESQLNIVMFLCICFVKMYIDVFFDCDSCSELQRELFKDVFYRNAKLMRKRYTNFLTNPLIKK
jgi:hypothetical protein